MADLSSDAQVGRGPTEPSWTYEAAELFKSERARTERALERAERLRRLVRAGRALMDAQAELNAAEKDCKDHADL